MDLTVRYKKRETTAEFEIVNITQESVLSGSTAGALGLIVRLDSLQQAAQTHKSSLAKDNTSAETAPESLSDFPELTRTTGTLPGKYTIKIEPNAKGIVHAVCWKTAALKEKIVEKLQEMEEDG